MSKKLKLWDAISKEMGKHGYNVPGNVCDNKYRNLLNTYRRIKDKRNNMQGRELFSRWRYFDMFEIYFKNNYSSNAITPLVDDVDDDNVDVVGEESKDKKKPRMTISRYLEFKIKTEERKRKYFIALEEKKLKLEYKRLELERKKIEVFQNLVSVLKQGKMSS